MPSKPMTPISIRPSSVLAMVDTMPLSGKTTWSVGVLAAMIVA